MKKQKEKVKLKILKEVEVSGWVLMAYLGYLPEYWEDEPFEFNGKTYTNIDDFEHDYPSLVGVQPHGQKTIVLKIGLDDGMVYNWRTGIEFDFHDYKICDSGYYSIMDEEWDPIAILEDYVPSCLGKGGYGDYLEFEITKDGRIPGWRFDQSDFDEIVKQSQD